MKKTRSGHKHRFYEVGVHYAGEVELDLWICECGVSRYMMDEGEVTDTMRVTKHYHPIRDYWDDYEYVEREEMEELYGDSTAPYTPERSYTLTELEEFTAGPSVL